MKRRPEPIRCVGLLANTEKPDAIPLLGEATRLLQAHAVRVSADPPTLRMSGLRLPRYKTTAELAEANNLLMVFGGDGTILRVAREIAGGATPLVGIHVGRLGFLAEVTAGRLAQAIDQIVAGDFRIESRPLIEAENGEHPPLRALNDFVFARGDVSRIIELEVTVDDEELTQYRCDGLIVSSPTGSTAYSLAAGGAIISPSARVFSLTPICPLTLSNQSVIVDIESTIRVRVCTARLQTHLTADGQVAVRLRHGDEIAIRRTTAEVRLLRLGGSSFFKTLRQKLHWSGSHA